MALRLLPKDPVPGQHYWLSYEEMLEHWPHIAGKDPTRYVSSCLWCGVMKRRDDRPQNPCKGRVKIGLR